MIQSASPKDASPTIRSASLFIVLLSFVFIVFSAVALGQELAATLTGTVTDSTGAVIPGATVLVHSQDTGTDLRMVTTSNSGNFNITNIPAGHYTVTVNEAGFEKFVAKDLVLYTSEKHTLDVQLKAGQVSETVEVTAENAPVQTTTAEQSGTVTGEQVRELALNNRNFEQLVLLQPGVANQLPDKPEFGLGGNTTISINGARAYANNWTVDGGDVNDSGSNGTLLNTPSIDAIQEFTLERSNYDAAFGRSGGGQIVVATKSGTNEFHGSAYEFNRNNFYNANTFGDRQAISEFGSPAAQNKTPIERYNDFGFTFGGPFWIPKLYNGRNKTFFFWSEEWRKATTPATNEITVPTAAELAGTFTTPVLVAPQNCVTTAGTGANATYTISPSCYSLNAAAYLKAFMANNPPNAGNLLITPYSQLNNFREDIIRLDQTLGQKVRVYARYMQDSVPQNFPYSLWGGNNYPGVETTNVNAPGRNLVINESTSINPHVVNEVEFVDAWGAINASLDGIANAPAFVSELTKTAFADPWARAPNVSISNYTGLANGSAPYFERNIDRNIFDNLSIQHSNHTIRLGLTSMWMQKTENASAGAATFNFTNANGNDPFANFLLGQADNFSQPDKDTIPHLRYINFEAYVQDDWKVSPKLTLNLGVRYSFFPSPTDSNNTLVNFDPLVFQTAQAPAIDPGTGNMVANSTNANAATYSNGLIFPSGATCSAAQAIYSQAICSPYGSIVNPNANNNWGPRLGIAYDPLGNGKWAVRGGFGIFYDRTLNGIWEQNAFRDPPLVQTVTNLNATNSTLNLFDNYAAGTGAGPSLGPNTLQSTGNPTFKVPSYTDYNLSVQHEFMKNTVAEVGYVGTKGTHLLGDIDLNQPTVAARESSSTPFYDVNALRPYPGYGPIISRAPIFTSNYNSFQASLNRRFTKGLTLGAAYTWSKLLTNNPSDRQYLAYNTYNLKQAYGLSTLNTPQMFVMSYIYDFPFYKGQRGLPGQALGGWELSGITTIQSGQSLTIVQNLDPWQMVTTNAATPYCTTPPCPVYPGGIGFNRLPWWTSAYIAADQSGSTSGPKTVLKYFNTSAFTDAVGHFGSEHTGSVLGPGYQLWDMSLIKNFTFTERAQFQLRLETFNTFNHGNPGASATDGIDVNVDSPTYGQVNNWHDPRTVQLGAKLRF